MTPSSLKEYQVDSALNDTKNKIRKEGQKAVLAAKKIYSSDESKAMIPANSDSSVVSSLNIIEYLSLSTHERKDTLKQLWALLDRTDILIKNMGSVEKMFEILGWLPIYTNVLNVEDIVTIMRSYGEECGRLLNTLPAYLRDNPALLELKTQRFSAEECAKKFSNLSIGLWTSKIWSYVPAPVSVPLPDQYCLTTKFQCV